MYIMGYCLTGVCYIRVLIRIRLKRETSLCVHWEVQVHDLMPLERERLAHTVPHVIILSYCSFSTSNN